MASVKMCDFCGAVKTQMAAEVLIRPVDSNADVFDGYEVNRSTGAMQRPSMVKDCCHDCVEQFTKVRELKVLEANADL